jgi:GDPmannose 4,6-dehydratase
MTRRTALICGASGQDGAYLAQLLLDKGYRVVGTSRDAATCPFDNLAALGLRERVECLSMAMNDRRGIEQVLAAVRPQEIYNLAGQSSVGLSFEQPVETFDGVAVGCLNLLETVRRLDCGMRVFNAGSADCFGETGTLPADETTPLRPRSPYAVAKAAALWEVATYREAYGLFACTGILFNHESPLRPARFVTQKIVQAACRIAAGSPETLMLGNIDIERDWGWAPEYVEAMWRMLQADHAADYVLATGSSHPLSAFVEAVFDALGLRWQDHVRSDPALLRPTDIRRSRANPARALEALGWRAVRGMRDVARDMVAAARR